MVDPAVERFRRMLRYRTVSARMDEPEIAGEFTAFLDHLPGAYPALFAAARVARGDDLRLVIELPGRDPGLRPLLLLAHFDVVDVEPGTESDWTHPPFDAAVDDGYVWARGALDDKNVLCALLEAAERIVSDGVPLARGVTIALGGDEELSGRRGAGRIAEELAGGRSDRPRFCAVVDEGAVIVDGLLAGPTAPIAVIGVAEKGLVNVRLSAEGDGGHAAMPPSTTAAGRLARAVTRIERRPHRARLTAAVERFFRAVGSRTGGALGVIYRHPRLFGPLLRSVLARRPSSNALIRTTQAVTMLRGSAAPNVLPQRAEAVVNVRILPGESVAGVLEHYRRVVRGNGVSVDAADTANAGEPVCESPVDHPVYRAIERAADGVCPGCVPAPFLVTGTTDSKWYASLAEGVYRFVPMTLSMEDIARIHGTDERIAVAAFLRMISFYGSVIEEVCGG